MTQSCFRPRGGLLIISRRIAERQRREPGPGAPLRPAHRQGVESLVLAPGLAAPVEVLVIRAREAEGPRPAFWAMRSVRKQTDHQFTGSDCAAQFVAYHRTEQPILFFVAVRRCEFFPEGNALGATFRNTPPPNSLANYIRANRRNVENEDSDAR